jgi:hypothetical protein
MTGTFGPSFDPKLDGERLHVQHVKIRNYMLQRAELGEWTSLEDIEYATGYPQASISAQLRHLRKSQFGSYIVNKKRVGSYWLYMVNLPIKVGSESPVYNNGEFVGTVSIDHSGVADFISVENNFTDKQA